MLQHMINRSLVAEIQLPLVPAHARLSEEQAEYIGQVLKHKYEGGRSIRELSEETSCSIARVRALLDKADTPLRPRGGSR